jgi:hypothetical protein
VREGRCWDVSEAGEAGEALLSDDVYARACGPRWHEAVKVRTLALDVAGTRKAGLQGGEALGCVGRICKHCWLSLAQVALKRCMSVYTVSQSHQNLL